MLTVGFMWRKWSYPRNSSLFKKELMKEILRELHTISEDFDYSQIEKLLLYFDTSKNLNYVVLVQEGWVMR